MLSAAFELLQVNEGDERLFLVASWVSILFHHVYTAIAAAYNQLLGKHGLRFFRVLKAHVVEIGPAIILALLTHVLLQRCLIFDPAVVPVKSRHHDSVYSCHVLLAEYEVLLVNV